MSRRVFGWCRPFSGLAVLAAVLVISGCGVSQLTSSLGSGLFGSQEAEEAWTATVSEDSLLAEARSNPDGPVGVATPGGVRTCPSFTVWSSDRHVTYYQDGQIGDSLAVTHRGEITKTARECRITPDRVTVKYGFAGRVLLGSRGQPGAIALPAQVYVMDPARNRVASETVTVQVQISANNPVGYFSAVREISFPLQSGATPRSYNVFVAFDRTAPGAG